MVNHNCYVDRVTGETDHLHIRVRVILILVGLVEVRRSTHHGQDHSLGWDHRVYKEETVSFAPDFTSPKYDCGCILTISNYCCCDFSDIVDCNLKNVSENQPLFL